MMDVRVRTVIPEDELRQKVGKILTESDYNLLLTGRTTVRKPDGSLLCIYVPAALSHGAVDQAYPPLRSLKSYVSDNRGDASGTQRVRREGDKRTRTKRVASAMIGNFDPVGPKKYCRHSSWTIRNPEKWAAMHPLFQEMGEVMHRYVPDRYAKQLEHVRRTDPEWIIAGTPFTTITVNNTYPTGVHTDRGDLETGFSTLAVLRSPAPYSYSGGVLVFPKFRLGVDMKHGDMMLMDAHEFHGNTMLHHVQEGAERISIVAYYRTALEGCGTADEELAKAHEYHESGGVLR